MSVKTAGVGHFAIPTAPAAGTSCTSGAANTFTTTYVQMIASTAAALYITGIFVESAAALAGTYDVVQLATGAAGSETIVGQYLISLVTGSTVASNYRPIFPPIPVPVSTRIAVKTADSVGAKATLITLECIAQSNVVDDGIAVGTVTTVTNQLTAAAIATGVWKDATAGDFTVAGSIGKDLFVGGINPGAAGGHFIAGTNAATTITTGLTTTFTGNLTGSVASVTGAVGSVTGAVGSVTGNVGGSVASVTAAVSITGDLSATMKTSVTTAATAATPTAAAVTGSVGSVVGLTASNLDATISSRMATFTLPTNFSALSITAGGAVTAGTVSDKTGYSLTQGFPANFAAFTIAATGEADANVKKVNAVTVNGAGTALSPWGP